METQPTTPKPQEAEGQQEDQTEKEQAREAFAERSGMREKANQLGTQLFQLKQELRQGMRSGELSTEQKDEMVMEMMRLDEEMADLQIQAEIGDIQSEGLAPLQEANYIGRQLENAREAGLDHFIEEHGEFVLENLGEALTDAEPGGSSAWSEQYYRTVKLAKALGRDDLVTKLKDQAKKNYQKNPSGLGAANHPDEINKW